MHANQTHFEFCLECRKVFHPNPKVLVRLHTSLATRDKSYISAVVTENWEQTGLMGGSSRFGLLYLSRNLVYMVHLYVDRKES